MLLPSCCHFSIYSSDLILHITLRVFLRDRAVAPSLNLFIRSIKHIVIHFVSLHGILYGLIPVGSSNNNRAKKSICLTGCHAIPSRRPVSLLCAAAITAITRHFFSALLRKIQNYECVRDASLKIGVYRGWSKQMCSRRV